MKKIFAFLVTLTILAGVCAGCGKENVEQPLITQAPSSVQTEAPAEIPTEAAFTLTLEGVTYPQDSDEITVSSFSEEDLALLPQLTALKTVTVTDNGDGANLDLLQNYCAENGIQFQIALGDEILYCTETELTLEGVTEAQVRLLALMPHLQTLHLPEPLAPAEALLELRTKLPNTSVTWEKTILGLTFSHDATEIDLTPVIARAEGQSMEEKTAYEYGLEFQTMGTQEKPPKTAKVLGEHPFPDKADSAEAFLAEAETAMPYFPEAKQLLMCGAWLDNEAMAQFRENHRADYKVIWTVRCGNVAPRTDATFFMPTKFFVQEGAFTDLDSYNLMYCEEMESIDLGHMVITDLEFVRYMPNLKHLVLSWTFVNDLSPLSGCKNLTFLEYNWVDLDVDYTPLLECTALQDLNIGKTKGDITPVLEMTWLENLWIVGFPQGSYERAKAALPDTNVAYYYGDPVDGWRDLPGYRAMRDALLMFYMD